MITFNGQVLIFNYNALDDSFIYPTGGRNYIKFRFDDYYQPAFSAEIEAVQNSVHPNIWTVYNDSKNWDNFTDYIMTKQEGAAVINPSEILEIKSTNVTSMNETFAYLHFSAYPSFDTSKVVSMVGTFSGNTAMEEMPNLDTSRVSSMSGTFCNCSSLKTVPKYNTSNVTNMNTTFYNCYSLSSVPEFDTRKVVTMGSTFMNCTNLKSATLLNTSAVTWMAGMFAGCSALTSVPLYNTENVSVMQGMFMQCSSLSSLPNLNTTNVRIMDDVCHYCVNLTAIPPSFDTRNVTSFTHAFDRCSALTSIPLLNTDKMVSTDYAFRECVYVQSGALNLYNQMTAQTTPPSYHVSNFARCGERTTNGAAELAQIPISWGGTYITANTGYTPENPWGF